MGRHLGSDDRLGLVHPSIDVHTLGISSVEQVLSDCGIAVIAADAQVNEAIGRVDDAGSARVIRDWIYGNHITSIGFSYRLDPDEGLRYFSNFMETLDLIHAFIPDGGYVRSLFFAGLPRACDLVEERFPKVTAVFRGDETPAETLDLLGVPRALLPMRSAIGVAYDESRMAFGRELISKGDYLSVQPVDRSDCNRFGERGDSISTRIAHGVARGLPPIIRAHVGPYLPHRKEAVSLFLDWTRRLAKAGFLGRPLHRHVPIEPIRILEQAGRAATTEEESR